MLELPSATTSLDTFCVVWQLVYDSSRAFKKPLMVDNKLPLLRFAAGITAILGGFVAF